MAGPLNACDFLSSRLHQATVTMQSQRCDDDNDIGFTKNNGNK